MAKRMVNTKMEKMTRKSDAKRRGICHFHATYTGLEKLGENRLKWHEVTLLSYYYIHMIPEGTVWPIFAPFKYRS
jgi:predicted transcriptional regulator